MGQGALSRTPLPSCPPVVQLRLPACGLIGPRETGLVPVFILPREVPESQGDISNQALRPAPPANPWPAGSTRSSDPHPPPSWPLARVGSYQLPVSLQVWDWRVVRVVFSLRPGGSGEAEGFL